MILKHTCPHCGKKGEIWVPRNAKKTELTCPICKNREDVSHKVVRDEPKIMSRGEWEGTTPILFRNND